MGPNLAQDLLRSCNTPCAMQSLGRALSDALRLASEPDERLATSLLIEARTNLRDERLLQPSAVPSLIEVLSHAAEGSLARSEWRDALLSAMPGCAADAADGPPTPPRQPLTVGDLYQRLFESVAPTSWCQRIAAALGMLLAADPPPPPAQLAPALLLLLRGAVSEKNGWLDASLQRRLLRSQALHDRLQ